MSSQYEKRKNKDKKPEATIEHPVEDAVNPEPVLTAIAYDVFYDNEIRKYVRVSVSYDLASGMAKVTSTKEIADSQPVSINKMKELFAKKILKVPFD